MQDYACTMIVFDMCHVCKLYIYMYRIVYTNMSIVIIQIRQIMMFDS